MKMIGITGTNGKTTTAFLTAGILKEAGYRVGMIGTIESYDGRRERDGEKHHAGIVRDPQASVTHGGK